jgi:hypothetical protein
MVWVSCLFTHGFVCKSWDVFLPYTPSSFPHVAILAATAMSTLQVFIKGHIDCRSLCF